MLEDNILCDNLCHASYLSVSQQRKYIYDCLVANGLEINIIVILDLKMLFTVETIVNR